MAETSIPWDGTTVGDAGAYGSSDWSDMYKHMLGFDADAANASVIQGIEDELKVVATNPVSTQVEVSTGSALVQGKYYRNTAALAHTISANASGNTRIDAVVLRVDYGASVQTVRAVVIEGTPAASPARPGLTQTAGVMWEVPLAYITVASGFASLAQSVIEDQRTYANTPATVALQCNNQSATVLEAGNVVIYDSPQAGYPILVNTSTTEADILACGIIEASTGASGGLGRIITRGIVPVIGDAALAVGEFLVHSSTAGQVTSGNRNHAFGVVLTASSGAGAVGLAYVNFPLLYPYTINQSNIQYNHGSAYTTTSSTFSDVDASNLILTLTTSGGDVEVEFLAPCAAGGANTINLDIYDVTNAQRIGNAATDGLAKLTGTANQIVKATVSGLAAGTAHSFKLQFASNDNANTVTIDTTTAAGVACVGIIKEL